MITIDHIEPLKGPSSVETVLIGNENEYFIDILIKSNDKCFDTQTQYEIWIYNEFSRNVEISIKIPAKFHQQYKFKIKEICQRYYVKVRSINFCSSSKWIVSCPLFITFNDLKIEYLWNCRKFLEDYSKQFDEIISNLNNIPNIIRMGKNSQEMNSVKTIKNKFLSIKFASKNNNKCNDSTKIVLFL